MLNGARQSPQGLLPLLNPVEEVSVGSGAEKWRNFKERHLVFRTIMELIFAVSVAMTVFTVVLFPCIILCLGVLLVLCIDDSFVSPVVAYVAFPETVMISGFLLLRYCRQISEFLRSISP